MVQYPKGKHQTEAYQPQAAPKELRRSDSDKWYYQVSNSSVDSAVAILCHLSGCGHERSKYNLTQIGSMAVLYCMVGVIERAKRQCKLAGEDLRVFEDEEGDGRGREDVIEEENGACGVSERRVGQPGGVGGSAEGGRVWPGSRTNFQDADTVSLAVRPPPVVCVA